MADPTPTPEEVMLGMLKVDLWLSTNAYDARLSQYITSAKAEIIREGYTFPETLTIDDMQLIVLKAQLAWLTSRGRRVDDLKRMLRFKLNNAILSQKMGGDSGD
jgi:hypothetical protein